jgi:pimeloyl-ACP methyl ester carboxylesterase
VSIQLFGGVTLEFELAPNMVVFSHGFGVRRDGRGMFTEIAQNLPKGYGYVLFDYYEVDEQQHTVRITDFAEQTERLKEVLEWTSAQKGVESVSLIAHSMGCIVAALAHLGSLDKLILLAPPTSIGERTRKHFTTKKGAEKHDDMWVVPCNDGTISIIPESLFDQYETVHAETALLELADERPYKLIVAGSDGVVTDADYSRLAQHSNVQYVELAKANHDFEGSARPLLLDEISNTF